MHRKSINYWLVKSEPETYSWQRMQKEKVARWDGVRNFQARNHLKAMKAGDFCFFYHSGKEKAIVGIIKIIKEHYPDPSDETKAFVAVDVEYLKPLNNPVTLNDIKTHEKLAKLPLLKQSRLSVVPISKAEWEFILKLSAT